MKLKIIKQFNEILKSDSNFIKNLVTEKLEEMKENEKITEKLRKKYIKVPGKSIKRACNKSRKLKYYIF